MNTISSFFTGIVIFFSGLFGYSSVTTVPPVTVSRTEQVAVSASSSVTVDTEVATSTNVVNEASNGSISTITAPDKKLGLFIIYDYERTNEEQIKTGDWWEKEESLWYMNDGVIENGIYKGWKRIVGFKMDIDNVYGGDDYGTVSYFITKDDKSYITDNQNLNLFNKDKVVSTTTIPTTFPDSFMFNDFVLIKEKIVNKERFPKNGALLINDTTKGFEVKANPLSFYTEGNDEYYKKVENYFNDSRNKYFLSSSEFFLKDTYGVVAKYLLVSKKQYEEHKNNLDGLFKFEISKKEFKIDDSKILDSMFTTYGDFLTNICIYPEAVFVQNIKEEEVFQIGSLLDGRELYSFKNTNNPLALSLYNLKNEYSRKKILQNDYLKRTPVLLVKDPWGNYMAISERDFHAGLSCPK